MSDDLTVRVGSTVCQVNCVIFVRELYFEVHLIKVSLVPHLIRRCLILHPSCIEVVLPDIVLFLVVEVQRAGDVPTSALVLRPTILNLVANRPPLLPDKTSVHEVLGFRVQLLTSWLLLLGSL